MRVVHVVTLMSDDAAFGGPMRVALNQAAELRRRGHEVTVVAGYAGSGPAPSVVDGVAVRLFRVHRLLPGGFSGLVAPGMLCWLNRNLPSVDVVHVHVGRDLITLPAVAVAHRHGRPVVVQTHGMVGPDLRPVARIFDVALTRRLLTRVRTRLVLTAQEAAGLREVLGDVSVEMLKNGVDSSLEHAVDPPRLEVLFVARLHPRKRPLAFVRAAVALHAHFPAVCWTLIGPDAGELEAVRALIAESDVADSVRCEGAVPYEEVAGRLALATVYVLPSVQEPFPMSLLEAMRAGLACVCTDSCGFADTLRDRDAALVIGPGEEELVTALDTLLSDPPLRRRLATNARATVDAVYSIRLVVDELEGIYRASIRAA